MSTKAKSLQRGLRGGLIAARATDLCGPDVCAAMAISTIPLGCDSSSGDNASMDVPSKLSYRSVFATLM